MATIIEELPSPKLDLTLPNWTLQAALPDMDYSHLTREKTKANIGKSANIK